MNVLFLSLLDFDSLDERNIYTDLLRTFNKNGHNLYVISPVERHKNQPTRIIENGNVSILKLRIGNTQKTNIIEKGISTLTLENLVKSGIKKYYSNIKFDLVLYSTPPITFANVIEYVKKRDNAKSYLLLKDIFPQNAVDIGMLTKTGLKSILYKFFKKKEEKLYCLSDFIGCMSQANIDYLIKNNTGIDKSKLHINPNSFEVQDIKFDEEKKEEIYNKYSIPKDVTTFLYGGNLGKPQDIPFIINCLKYNLDKEDRYFVICGNGTEYGKLKCFVEKYNPKNVRLLDWVPRAEYEDFIKYFDVGLIFLDHRFTIPNFPSRLLSYMQSKMPILACTDKNTDIGKVITENNFGWWCESNDETLFTQKVDEAIKSDLSLLGENAFSYLSKHYTVDLSYQKILNCFLKENI
ncbi:MAG: glycosyltransferase family 4 protein [Ruminococcaceae bacterium]|nr:glycosyltransferase family 4 protein [Oscillospiraceae bacterium]